MAFSLQQLTSVWCFLALDYDITLSSLRLCPEFVESLGLCCVILTSKHYLTIPVLLHLFKRCLVVGMALSVISLCLCPVCLPVCVCGLSFYLCIWIGFALSLIMLLHFTGKLKSGFLLQALQIGLFHTFCSLLIQ